MLFDNLKYAGHPKDCDTILEATAGDRHRGCIKLFLCLKNNVWHASFLVTGGVVMTATCEYWAELFNDNHKGCMIRSDDVLNNLEIDKKWRGDIFLIEQAAMKLDQQLLELPHGRNRKSDGARGKEN
jgi:hypothetical protein